MTTPITIDSRSLAPVFEAVVELLATCRVVREAEDGCEPWEELVDAEVKVAKLLGLERDNLGEYVAAIVARVEGPREVEDVPGLHEELANLTDPNS